MPKGKLNDFGEKIGGARKDLWAIRGLMSSDLADLTDYEKKEYINKNNIWKKPDYEAMLAEGRPREVIYFIKLVRDALPPKFAPSYLSEQTADEQYAFYIDFIQEFKNLVMDVKTVDEIKQLHDYLDKTGKIEHCGYLRYKVNTKYWNVVSNKLVNVMNLYGSGINRYIREIRKKQFLYTDYEKATLKYDIILLTDKSKIDKQTLSDFDIEKLKEIKADRIAIIGVHCQSDIQTDGKSQLGVFLSPAKAEEIMKDAKIGDYLCFYRGQYLFKAEAEKQAYDNCWEHYKANNKVTEQQKQQSSRKPNYIPPQLRKVDRKGPVWRLHNRNVDGEKMLDDFKFRGGEFGNWLNESDRKQSLNFCYDALMDLSYALGMQPSDISFNGTLAIAFGARGRGGAKSAVAHYEPARQVINLTKMKGAGSLGHEWIHAMDHAVTNYCAGSFISLATKSGYSIKKEIPEEFFDVMKVIKESTNFINAAKAMDQSFGSDSQGYWQSDCELLARAGACWLHDRLTAAGIQNDYLVGHAEGKLISPHGEERAKINQAFNKWLEKAKEIGLFNQEYLLPGRSEDMNLSLEMSDVAEEDIRAYDPTVEYVQVSLFDLPELAECSNEPEEDIDI